MSDPSSDDQTTERESIQRWILGACVFAIAFVIGALGAGSGLRSDLHHGDLPTIVVDLVFAGIVPGILSGFSVRWLRRRQAWKRAVALDESQREA